MKRHVVSPTILTDWRFDTFLDMAPYTAAELAAVPDGVDLSKGPELVQVSGNPAVYVADGAFKRHVVNPTSFAAWRFTSGDIKAITASALAALEAGPDWPAEPLLVKDPSDPAVYVLDVPLPTAAEDDAGSASWDTAGSGNGAGCTLATGTPASGAQGAWLVGIAVLGLAAARRKRP